MRGATVKLSCFDRCIVISTHTPHAGRDGCFIVLVFVDRNFYSHAPCGARRGVCLGVNASSADFYSHAPCGARRTSKCPRLKQLIFLLTRPMRGATWKRSTGCRSRCISTHTPHAGRDHRSHRGHRKMRHFYSHAPCGARPDSRRNWKQHWRFLLTRPMRGATRLTSPRWKHQQFLLTRPMRGATTARRS